MPLETITVLSGLGTGSGVLDFAGGGSGAGLTGALLGLTKGLEGNEELDLLDSLSGVGEVDFRLIKGRLGTALSANAFLFTGMGADL